MLQSYVLVWQEESLIQLLKNLWHHVNCVGNSYYLPSDKGYERILWKLRGYECVERLRTTALHCKQTQKGLKNYNSGLGCWSPRRNLFSEPLRNRNPCLGRDPYYGLNRTSRCKVRCADQSRGTRWDGQKNEVITFSRDAKINTAAAFNIQRWIADSFINWLCKTKKKV